MACVLVTEGAGVAIVDPFSASEFVGRGLALRAFEPAWIIGTAVIHSRNRPLSITAREFHAEFLEHARSFLERAEYLRA
jgi:hypothetical protein